MCSKTIKSAAYFGLVRPNLEYATCAWDPYTVENKRKLESVQHKAARFVVGNYNWNISSEVITDELGWQTLEHRRKHQRLKLMYRAVNAPGSIRLPLTLNRSSVRISRQSHHSKCFIPPQCRTDVYRNTFFPWTLREWSTLPPELMQKRIDNSFQQPSEPTSTCEQ